MNRKIRDALFFLIVFTLVLYSIPKPIQLNFIGGPVGGKFCVYPLLAGFLYSFWCQYKYGNVFSDAKKFLKYIAIYIFVMLLSTVVGLITYPYYDLVLNGPVGQIEKLPRVLAFLHAHGIEADAKPLMQAWLCVRQVKGVFMQAFWNFGGAYLMYCWYRSEWKRAFEILLKGTLLSLLPIFAYACVETAYLAGNKNAAEILKAVNPYLYSIATTHGWWPPLLWKGQMRLVLPEPSFVGNYFAFVLPLLWGAVLTARKKSLLYTGLFATAVIAFCVGMTKARTSYAMLVGMIVLLLLLIIIGKQWKLLKKYVLILCCVGIGFGAFVGFSGVMIYEKTGVRMEASEIAGKALDDNLGSLAAGNKRSNGARYALIKSGMRTGLEHPILGVGPGLSQAFIVDHFTEEEAQVGEVSMWIRLQKKYGPMDSHNSVPGALNEYVNRFMNTGILGLGVFLFPFLYVWFLLFKQMRKDSTEALALILLLVSALASGCNNNIDIFYSTWIMLGLSYVYVFGKNNEKEDGIS